jgi:hypothetical protein
MAKVSNLYSPRNTSHGDPLPIHVPVRRESRWVFESPKAIPTRFENSDVLILPETFHNFILGVCSVDLDYETLKAH